MRCCCIHHIQYRIGDNTIERAHTFNVYRITPHYSTQFSQFAFFSLYLPLRTLVHFHCHYLHSFINSKYDWRSQYKKIKIAHFN